MTHDAPPCHRSYADYFTEKRYNGRAVTYMTDEDVDNMPETDAIKRRMMKGYLKEWGC